MSWVRVESKMPGGAKFAGITSAAGWWYTRALCWTADNLTDGFIPAAIVHSLTNDSRRVIDNALSFLTEVHAPAAQALIHRPGERCDSEHCPARDPQSAYALHDYLDPEYDQPTKAGLEELKRKKADAGRQGGLAKARASKGHSNGLAPASEVLDESQPSSASKTLAPSRIRIRPVESLTPSATSLSPGPATSNAIDLNADEVTLCKAWEGLTGRPPTETDRTAFRTMLVGATRLSAQTIARELTIKGGEFIRANRPVPPAKYFLRRIEEMNDLAADRGEKPRERSHLRTAVTVGAVIAGLAANGNGHATNTQAGGGKPAGSSTGGSDEQEHAPVEGWQVGKEPF